jgi:hypothetical protein
METYPLDIAPEHVLAWLMDEERRAPGTLLLRAIRSYIAEEIPGAEQPSSMSMRRAPRQWKRFQSQSARRNEHQSEPHLATKTRPFRDSSDATLHDG